MMVYYELSLLPGGLLPSLPHLVPPTQQLSKKSISWRSTWGEGTQAERELEQNSGSFVIPVTPVMLPRICPLRNLNIITADGYEEEF